MNNVADFII